jgi:hypothetical protein
MGATKLPEVVQQKLTAFTALEPEFAASFAFVQAVHGQRRFAHLSVADVVRYLHACYICECKDRLLSVPQTIRRYRGDEALDRLGRWQAGDTAGVVAFLDERLDGQPFAQITAEVTAAQRQPGQQALAERLAHGRLVLLNRAMNLTRLLDAIFAPLDAELIQAVREAAAALGHTPEQIASAPAAFATPLYAFVPHHALAERNMRVMNMLGIDALVRPADLPGARTWRVLPPAEPPGPFAEIPIPAYTELTSPLHNNLCRHRFIDHADTLEDIARSKTILIEEIGPTPIP